MSIQSLRTGSSDLRSRDIRSRDVSESALYELDPVRVDGRVVAVALSVRFADDGVWRGRLEFQDGEPAARRATAEIFCGPSEDELWQSVRALGEHHVRDLCRSLL